MHANTLFGLGLCLLSISGIGSGFTVPEGLVATGDIIHLDTEPKLEAIDTVELIRENNPLDSHIRSAAAAAAAAASRSYFRDNSDAVRSPSSKALNDAVAAYRKMVAATVMRNSDTVRAVEPDRDLLPLRFVDQMRPIEPTKHMSQVRYMEALKQLEPGKTILPYTAASPLRFVASSYAPVEPIESIAYGEEIIPIGRMSDEEQAYHYFDNDDSYARNYLDEPRPSDYMRQDEFRIMPEDEESLRNANEEEIIRMAHDSSLEAYLQSSENQMRLEAARSAAAAAAASRSAAAAAAARSAATRNAVAAAARTAATRSAAAAAAARSAAAAAAARSAAAAAVAARSAGVRPTSSAARSAAAAAAAASRSAARSAAAAAAA